MTRRTIFYLDNHGQDELKSKTLLNDFGGVAQLVRAHGSYP